MKHGRSSRNNCVVFFFYYFFITVLIQQSLLCHHQAAVQCCLQSRCLVPFTKNGLRFCDLNVTFRLEKYSWDDLNVNICWFSSKVKLSLFGRTTRAIWRRWLILWETDGPFSLFSKGLIEKTVTDLSMMKIIIRWRLKRHRLVNITAAAGGWTGSNWREVSRACRT